MSGGWVCDKCGLDYDTISPSDTAVAVRSYPRRYRALLVSLDDDADDPDAIIRRRPEERIWSALEYTAHVADVMDDLTATIKRMLIGDTPTFGAGFDPDARAVEDGYNLRDRDEVLAHLDRGCAALASVLEGVQPSDWLLTGRFDYGQRDVLAIARNAVHEGAHHLRDVERGLAAVRLR